MSHFVSTLCCSEAGTVQAWPASYRAALEMGAALPLVHPCSIPTCPCFGRCRDSVSTSDGFFCVEREEQRGKTFFRALEKGKHLILSP